MFAGIIEAKARVLKAERDGSVLAVTIQKPRVWKLTHGQSVNVDGICSTVVHTTPSSFRVEYMPETLSKTTAVLFRKGSLVNLERSLKYGDRIDGHLVQGHVDVCTPVRQVRHLGSSKEITIKPPAKAARSALQHGSIALNGVSLTVARKHGPNLTVALIPYTLKGTNLGSIVTSDMVNVEFDHSAIHLAASGRK